MNITTTLSLVEIVWIIIVGFGVVYVGRGVWFWQGDWRFSKKADKKAGFTSPSDETQTARTEVLAYAMDLLAQLCLFVVALGAAFRVPTPSSTGDGVARSSWWGTIVAVLLSIVALAIDVRAFYRDRNRNRMLRTRRHRDTKAKIE